jgi:hypothetical protein
MERDGTPDQTRLEDIRSSKRFPKKSNTNAINNFTVPVGCVPRTHRLIGLEYLKHIPLPPVGEDEGEGGPKLLLSTPTLKGEGIPGRNALKARKIHLIISCNPFNQERSFSKAPVNTPVKIT